MRILKLVLIALLVVVGALFCLSSVSELLSGDDVPPVIQCDTDLIEVSVSDGDEVLLAGVTASDEQDGDLTGRIRVLGVSKLLSNDTAKVSYVVFDSDGNVANFTRKIRYTDYEKPHFTVEAPLVYTEDQDIQLLDRLLAKDVVDGDITGSIRVSALSGTSDPEINIVAVQVTNSMGDTAYLELPIVIYAGAAQRPEIQLSEYLVYVNQGASFDPARYLQSVDTPVGAGNTGSVQITNEVDTANAGTYYVYYRYPYNTTAAQVVLTVVVE